MRRTLIAAIIIGLIVSALVIGAQVSDLLLRPEAIVGSFILRFGTITRGVREAWQYVFVVVLAIGVAFLALRSLHRGRLASLIGVFVLELASVSFVCLLYHAFFQPLPSILSVTLAFVTAQSYSAVRNRTRSGVASALFVDRISARQLARIARGELPLASEARAIKATAVVCDIANKHDLADECEPREFAELTEKFIAHVTSLFIKAGAYIETATGEGVVAIFGFPVADPRHAENATRESLNMVASFNKLRAAGSEPFDKLDVHLGVSSGTMIVGPVSSNGRAGLLATGEPIELARRFCIANRFYGSRVLIGPHTFELADKTIIARPIDFLSGVDVRERHEIYEPLMLAADAKPEDLTRRDNFWNGVVLYREKRWGEAYTRFQEARGPNQADDAPLQLYLRRLEPLALQLTDIPVDE